MRINTNVEAVLGLAPHALAAAAYVLPLLMQPRDEDSSILLPMMLTLLLLLLLRTHQVQSLSRQLMHDPLTGVLTRAAFSETLDREIRRTERDGGGMTGTAVAFVDVDDFKQINDRYYENK